MQIGIFDLPQVKAHKFPYKWTLADAVFTKNKGKVFSCFACGGGSTMGYKLAGFDVLGCNEIDPKMIEAYKANHNPKYAFLEPIQTFKDRTDLPSELYNLDILDGSPPCSSFSMAGAREKGWGQEKVFREGQAKQVLDTLFFDFIDLAKKLQPKVVIAENVKGLLQGNAITYYRKIHKELSDAGYCVTAFLLDASKMGVPQRRERVFVIGVRNDLAAKKGWHRVPVLDMDFNEKPIPFSEIIDHTDTAMDLEPARKVLWAAREYGDIDMSVANGRLFNKPNTHFGAKYLYQNSVSNTITSSDICTLFDYPRERNKKELLDSGTFPIDYDFGKLNPKYLIGMSVPPVMTAQIATRIYEQVLI